MASRFLPRERSDGRHVARVERVLAVGRAFLTITGFIAIYLDPTEPARLREVTYAVLFGYAVYSVAVLVYVQGTRRLTVRHGLVLHSLDILWTSALTFVSEGPVSPFFLFFLFGLLAAAYRWGFRETVGTAVLTIAVFLIETIIAAAGPWNATWFTSIDFDLNGTILRVAYLLLTGVLLGYLAAQEKHSRAELATIAEAARQPQINLGLGGSVLAVARMLRATFGARSIAIVVRDQDARRTLLWQIDAPALDAGAPRVRRTELDEHQQAAWLFQDPGRVWYAIAPSSTAETSVAARIAEPGAWRLKRGTTTVPTVLGLGSSFRNVMAVNLGLQGEWQARAYLLDVDGRGALERRLHFLEGLAEHITPALTNVFLVRRLRARAGASERARVARELHDGSIQALYGIEMKIEAIRRESRKGPTVTEAELLEIQDQVRQEVLALRELMQALRPIELDSGEQLPDVLVNLVERFRRDTGISARFVSAVGQLSLPPARALEVVRIVQEALVNVRKHSHARNVLVRLSENAGEYRLVVEDDGIGFEFEGRLSAQELDDRGIGPAVIKERARIAGAQLVLESSPGAGTRVEMTFAEESYV